MPKVYVTSEDPHLDYTPAFEFGDKIIGVFPPGQIHLNPQIALYRARAALRDITTEDYLALVGDPIKIGICFGVVMERLGVVNALRWNRQTTSYLHIAINFLDRNPPLEKGD